jgi:hypothetical protein
MTPPEVSTGQTVSIDPIVAIEAIFTEKPICPPSKQVKQMLQNAPLENQARLNSQPRAQPKSAI